jgi:hypothetical protein
VSGSGRAGARCATGGSERNLDPAGVTVTARTSGRPDRAAASPAPPPEPSLAAAQVVERTFKRDDGSASSLLRKNPTPDASDDAWLDNEAEVENDDTVELVREEGGFSLIRTRCKSEGWVRSAYLHEAAAADSDPGRAAPAGADAAPGEAVRRRARPHGVALHSVALCFVERGLATFCNRKQWTKQAAARGVAVSRCTTAHRFYTGLASVPGASFSEVAMRPDPPGGGPRVRAVGRRGGDSGGAAALQAARGGPSLSNYASVLLFIWRSVWGVV